MVHILINRPPVCGLVKKLGGSITAGTGNEKGEIGISTVFYVQNLTSIHFEQERLQFA